MAVKEDGLWSKPLNSFGPGKFLSSDIGNVSGKHQILLHLDVRFLHVRIPKLLNTSKELNVLVLGQ